MVNRAKTKYAVIFKAKIKDLDEEYAQTADRMRDIAMKEYGCTEFIANSEGDLEIAISYWKSLEDIQAWKNNPEHKKAQALGKQKWYESFEVQVVEVLKEYGQL